MAKMRITYVYIVECEDGTLYTGITTDVKRRMKEHFLQKEKGAKYTHTRKVHEVRMVWEAQSYASAARLEYAIKKQKRDVKLQMIEAPEHITEQFLPMLLNECYQVKKEYCVLVKELIKE